MARFVQLHLLTFYPPANLNRDDTGRPKTAIIGGVERLRISSQSLKRAVRTSDVFRAKLDGHLGDRTQRLGETLRSLLMNEHGVDVERAGSIARVFAAIFGKLETAKGKELFIRQLAFVSPDEVRNLRTLMAKIGSDEEFRNRLLAAAKDVSFEAEEVVGEDDESSGKRAKKPKQSKETTKLIKELSQEVLTFHDTAADIAMFGRMLADNADFNREAAVQVAHAYTTHRVTVEDDFYTAVDDLKTKAEDAGAGFVGELGFGSGLFYLYVCIDPICSSPISAAMTASPSRLSLL
jgi:CRISPR system Cascade subunit CasC